MSKAVCCFVMIALVIFCSCRKETSSDQRRNNGHDSTLISEMIKLDTVRPSGQDTLVRFLFRYDTRDRLAKILVPGYGLNPVPGTIFELEYLYSGNDTLPKTYINKYWSDINQYPSFPPDYADTLYLFYSGNTIVKDSLLYHTSFNTAKITTFNQVSSGHYRVNVKEVFRSGAFYSSRGPYDVYVTKQGENIIEMRDTVPFFGGPLSRRINFTYDNKVNPFKRVALRYPFYSNFYFDGYVADFIPYFLTDLNANNMLSLSRHYPSIPSSAFQFKYDYLDNGLPSEVRTLMVHDYNQIFKY